MGNNQSSANPNAQQQNDAIPRIVALKLDQLQYQAGDIVQGRVHVKSPTNSQRCSTTSLQNVEGIHLLLEGHEHVSVATTKPINTEISSLDPEVFGNNGDTSIDESESDHIGSSIPRNSLRFSNGDRQERRRLRQQQRRQSRRQRRNRLKNKKKHRRQALQQQVERSTNTLVRVDYPILKGSDIKLGGQYEYAFKWRLPSHLPSSMHCRGGDEDPQSYAEIRYTLTAYIACTDTTTRNCSSSTNPTTLSHSNISSSFPNASIMTSRADTVIAITAKHSTGLIQREPLIMEMEHFPIRSCSYSLSAFCCFLWGGGMQRRSATTTAARNGSGGNGGGGGGHRDNGIYMGWRTVSDISRPGDTVNVEVFGENHTKSTRVHTVHVKWIETVTWSTSLTTRPQLPVTSNHNPNWNANASKPPRTVVRTRTLTQQQIPIPDDYPSWQPKQRINSSSRRDNDSTGGIESHAAVLAAPLLEEDARHDAGGRGGSSHNNVITARLQLPLDARDTYHGQLVQVRHTLVVSAETHGCCTTSPESACQVRVARCSPATRIGTGITNTVSRRRSSSAIPAIPSRSGNTSAPSAATATTAERDVSFTDIQLANRHLPEAQAVLATELGPIIVGDVIEVPEAVAVLIDEDIAVAEMRTGAVLGASSGGVGAGTNRPNLSPARDLSSTLTAEPSAPDESLRSSSQRGRISPDVGLQQPDLSQLTLLVREAPQNLAVVLEDAAFCTFAQNLSPREYAEVVAEAASIGTASTTAAPLIASTLARFMYPRFQCRHLLACLWSLPNILEDSTDSLRLQILLHTAPYLSDLTPEHQAYIEQELSPREIAEVREVLCQ